MALGYWSSLPQHCQGEEASARSLNTCVSGIHLNAQHTLPRTSHQPPPSTAGPVPFLEALAGSQGEHLLGGSTFSEGAPSRREHLLCLPHNYS